MTRNGDFNVGVIVSMTRSPGLRYCAVRTPEVTGDKPYALGLPKMWERVAKRAKLKDVTLHGLRHWFASAATELGYSDLIIGALLGHAKKGITGRYATAPDPALVAAADKISLALARALEDAAVADNVVRDGRFGSG